jgi:two-component system chemotaxis response regulator CheY
MHNIDKHILVVDDSQSMRELVGFVLESAGYKIIKKENGLEGLSFLKETTQSIDLLITDLFMPVMDGIELIRSIRSEVPNYSHLPILMLTTESQLDKKIDGKKAGATGWIVKPFEEDRLVATVKKLIG